MIYWILFNSLFYYCTMLQTLQTHAIKLMQLSVISIIYRNKVHNFHWGVNSRGNWQVNRKKEDVLQQASWIRNEMCDLTRYRQTDWTLQIDAVLPPIRTPSVFISPRIPRYPYHRSCAAASAVDNGPLTYSVRMGEGGTCVWCLCSERNKCYNSIVPTYCTTDDVKNITGFCRWTRRRMGNCIVNPPNIVP